MFVHGGAWQVGDKKSARDGYVPAFLKAGYAFCAVNYGLFPVSTPEQAADDIAAALAFARSNAKAWRFDPDRLVLIGLVALVALDARYLQRHQVPKDSLRALVLLDGAGYDIAWQVANGRNAELYQKVFGPSPDTWQRLSPLTYAPGGGPASLIHYIAARAPSRAQATALAGALRKAGTRVDLNAVTGETHSSIHRGFGAADDATTQKTFSFLAEVVSPTLPAPSR
jgi:acetyl esterase/lipase